MSIEQHTMPMIGDPMIEEANIWDVSLKKILSDKVLGGYLRQLTRLSPQDSFIKEHTTWLMSLFPTLTEVAPVPQPWVWTDLVAEAPNIGSIKHASIVSQNWISQGQEIAYWTGGLEFTQSQDAVATYLINKGMRILMGVEPITYPEEAAKGRGALVDTIVPISLWSKKLGENTFIFTIPRPRPAEKLKQDEFYRNLYQSITGGDASIVVSEKDPHKEEKMKRGKIVLVPNFEYPSTTELHYSFYS